MVARPRLLPVTSSAAPAASRHLCVRTDRRVSGTDSARPPRFRPRRADAWRRAATAHAWRRRIAQRRLARAADPTRAGGSPRLAQMDRAPPARAGADGRRRRHLPARARKTAGDERGARAQSRNCAGLANGIAGGRSEKRMDRAPPARVGADGPRRLHTRARARKTAGDPHGRAIQPAAPTGARDSRARARRRSTAIPQLRRSCQPRLARLL
jgi:hypothetical protein